MEMARAEDQLRMLHNHLIDKQEGIVEEGIVEVLWNF